MDYYFNYGTRCFMTTRELNESKEVLYLAKFTLGPRCNRPIYKGDFRYDPNAGIFRV